MLSEVKAATLLKCGVSALRLSSEKAGIVLVSLGSRRLTSEAIQAIARTAAASNVDLHWYLLDVCEASNLVVLGSLGEQSAIDRVHEQSLKFRTLIESASPNKP